MTNWKNNYQHLKLADLHLDLKNPRTDSGNNLSEELVISELLDENVIQLAQDIVQNGYTPVSVFMVAEENNKKVVIDGNRRLLALKLINNPKLVEQLIVPRDFTKIQELHEAQSEDLSSATSIIYPSRESAERDMAKLHLAGIAIQQWKLIRQYRYFQKRLDVDELSIDTLSELLTLNKSDIKKGVKTYQLFELAKCNLQDVVDEVGYDIFSDKYFKTDKFQRAIVNSSGERLLGYTFSDIKQKIEVTDLQIFFNRLRPVLLELYDTNPGYLSGAQFNSKERDDFFKSIDPHFLSDTEFRKVKKLQEENTANGQGNLFDNNKPATPQNIAPTPIPPQASASPSKEKGTKPKPDWVIDSDVRFYKGADRVKDILNELKKNTPSRGNNLNIVVVALRIVIELAIYHKLGDKGLITKIISDEQARIKTINKKRTTDGKPLISLRKNWTPGLKEMLAYLLDEANNIITDPQERKSLKLILSQYKDFVDDLDNFVHNVTYNPTETIARDIWKTFARPIFDILKKL